MGYPKILPKHQNQHFHETAIFDLKDNQFVKAYYHCLNESLPVLGMHSHNFYEVNIVTKGSAYHYINDNVVFVNEGDMFVLPPNVPHGYYTEEKQTLICHLLISTLFLRQRNEDLSKLSGFSYLFQVEPVLRSQIDYCFFPRITGEFYEYINLLLKRICDLEELKESKLQESLMIYILSEITNYSHLQISKKRENLDENIVAIIEIMEYINNHYSEKISFNDLVKERGMSYPTFYRNFVKLCKESPTDYLTECRIENALRYLNFTNESIANIALECGFFDSSHFIKAFTAKKNVSPLVYRKYAEGKNTKQ